MSDLVIIAYDSEAIAESARQKLLELKKEYLIEIGDAVVAVRQPDGTVKLNQLINMTATGAATGGMWGALIGMLFLNPLLGAALGAGAGALRRRDDQLLLCFVQSLAQQMPAVAGNDLQLLTGICAVQVDGHIRQAGRHAGHSGDRAAGVKHQRTSGAGVRIVEQHGRNITGARQGAGLVADAGVRTAGVF